MRISAEALQLLHTVNLGVPGLAGAGAHAGARGSAIWLAPAASVVQPVAA